MKQTDSAKSQSKSRDILKKEMETTKLSHSHLPVIKEKKDKSKPSWRVEILTCMRRGQQAKSHESV